VQFVVIASIVTSGELKYDDYTFPYWSNIVGWSIALSSMLFVPIYAIYKFLSVPGSLKEVSKRIHSCLLSYLNGDIKFCFCIQQVIELTS